MARRRFLNRVERFILGGVMGMIAFVIERRILKSIKKRGEPRPSAEPGLIATGDRDGLVVATDDIEQ